MSSVKYASAVAAVRAMESSLLSQSDVEAMANAAGFMDVAGILASSGRRVPEEYDELLGSLEKELCEIWEMISGYAPDCKELEILLYRNNFYNLKAALKALIINKNPESIFVSPTTLELDRLTEIVSSKSYEELPEYMRGAAEDAYTILTKNLDGQLAEVVIDTACLEAMKSSAKKSGSRLMMKYADLTAALSDIKTAYRCSIMNKTDSFMQLAVCGSSGLDRESLIRVALGGADNLLSYLDGTHFAEAAEKLRESTAAFEKWCDDELLSVFDEAKMQSFGAAPLAAYFAAKETEIKNLRILLVCKNCGAAKETIMERMRRLYV